ncbi:unnamed protein product [Onchocerca ochengi]|uniref:RNA polymerase I-specific transcription initiation factor RRN3 n=1 Tax=Onchocerca ochengi TaxID=42157 RepID=A0A182EBC8_ONCOC|nr:unnamed protein product [Onchocerca ochengi]
MYLILPDNVFIDRTNSSNPTVSDNQAVEDENERMNNQLLEKILDRLANKKYDEVYHLIIASRDQDIVAVYRQLFRVIIEEYDNDFVENGISDSMLENVLLLVKTYGASNDKLLVSLQCSDRVTSWKAFVMLGSFIEEILPELKDLNESYSYDIRKIYIPSWMERFEKNIVLNYPDDQLNKEYLSKLETDYLDDNYYDLALPDTSSDLFLSAVFMFLRIFTLSMSRNYGILDVLFDRILACTHIQSHFMEAFMLKLDAIYRFSDRLLPLNTLVFVNSFKARFCSLPRVFSPEYYLKLAIGPLRHSLHVSTSNMFNIGYVVLGFLADFIICCEECTLCKVREACMDTFKLFLSKFELVAQVLIIRKLFNMIRKNEIQRKNLHRINIHDEKSLKFEPQILAWIIDLFRSKLNYSLFRRELGFFWGDLVSIRYSSLSDGLQYYLSVFVLAQEQALRKLNPKMMLNIYEHYLQPLQVQISDWVALVEVQERQITHGNLEVPADQLAANMQRLEMETRQQLDSQSLPLLQFQIPKFYVYV